MGLTRWIGSAIFSTVMRGGGGGVFGVATAATMCEGGGPGTVEGTPPKIPIVLPVLAPVVGIAPGTYAPGGAASATSSTTIFISGGTNGGAVKTFVRTR